LRQRLESALGGEAALRQVANAVLDEAELMMASAHGLHNLEARFPVERAATLGENDRALLGQMRADHLANLSIHAGRLLRLAAPVRAALGPSAAGAPHLAGGGAFEAARRMDRALAVLFGGSASTLGPEQLAAEFEAAAEDLAAATGAGQ
jgi:hypothetical protein